MNESPEIRTVVPTTPEEVADVVRTAAEKGEAIYPVGGRKALDGLMSATRDGIELSLAGLDRVVEFSPRDLIVTVQAGMTLTSLAEIVRRDGLLFPFSDAYDAETATIGGLLACNWHNLRRTGWGNLRDYLIGVRAIDGRGVAYKSGGKVVKNVAGYDFCKLLVGSRGTLSVMVEVTLRLAPRPESSFGAMLVAAEAMTIDEIHAALRQPAIPHSVYDVVRSLDRPDIQGELLAYVGWEGPAEEIDVARREVDTLVASGRFRRMRDMSGVEFERQNAGLRSESDSAAFAIEIQAPPTTTLKALDSQVVVSHLNGMSTGENGLTTELQPRVGSATLSWAALPPPERALALLAALRDAIGDEGYVSVTRDREGLCPTRELQYGRTSSPQFLMDRVKAALDPRGILNPGRYVFADSRESRSPADVR